MAQEEVEREYEDVKKRRKGISKFISNLSDWQIIAILGAVIAVVFYVSSKDVDKKNSFILIFAVVAMIILFSKKSEKMNFVTEEIAKRIAVDVIESKKDDFHLPPDAEIVPTNFCRLERKNFEPYEWHVGIKIETREGKIDYWRVDIEPYEAIITGIVRVPMGFDGDEKPDVVYME